MTERVLIVDDEPVVLEFLQELLEEEGYLVSTALDGPSALARLEEDPDVLMLCDIRMPGMDGFELLEEVRNRYPAADVIIMTAFGSMDGAIEAMSLGAADYLIKPLKAKEIVAKVSSHLKRRQLESQLQELQAELRSWFGIDQVIARSPAMGALLPSLQRVAPSGDPVVLIGEPGSGRDFIARALHFSGNREVQLYRRVRCNGGTPAQALATLFGSQEAGRRRVHGQLEELASGTLHISGLESLPAEHQRQLARTLEERRFSPVGSDETIALGTRLVLSLPSRPADLVASGLMIEELARLLERTPVLRIPPLRERREDLPELVSSFSSRFYAERGDTLRIPDDSMEVLSDAGFPGNVSQLFATLAHCASLSPDGTLTPELIANGLSQVRPESATSPRPMAESLEDREYQLVLRAVNKHRGQLEMAAKELGISRTTLWRRMRKYGIRAAGLEDSGAIAQ